VAITPSSIGLTEYRGGIGRHKNNFNITGIVFNINRMARSIINYQKAFIVQGVFGTTCDKGRQRVMKSENTHTGIPDATFHPFRAHGVFK
jgi:hypothetical protein